MEFYTKSLDALNKDAEDRKFNADSLILDTPVDRSKKWVPEEFNYFSYLPSYANLPSEMQRRLNQFYALALCEQFVWFEQDLVIPVFTKILKWKGISADLKLALENFIEDEVKHTFMFQRMCRWAEPEKYQKNYYWLLNTSSVIKKFISFIQKDPSRFLVWSWLAILFEEKTLYFSRYYKTLTNQSPNEFDLRFTQLHHLHYLDEIRHHMLDEYLLEAFYDKAPRWKKQVAGYMFSKVVKAYGSPKRNAPYMLDKLLLEYPNNKEQILQLKKELPSLATNLNFHNNAYSLKSIPRTLNLMRKYPELKPCWQYLKFTRPKNWEVDSLNNLIEN